MNKLCCRCHSAPRAKSGGYCLKCRREYLNQWARNHKESRRNSHRKWANKPTVKKRRRKYMKAWQLRNKFGLTVEQYEEMKKHSNGCCYICGKKADILYVDHCHATNTIRGLLCICCNRALGLIKDNTTTLSRMINYLKKAG